MSRDLKQLETLLKDKTFVDYFNVFLNLPVFGQRVLFKLYENELVLDPPVRAPLQNDIFMEWIAEERYPLFLQTRLALEYRICCKFKAINFAFTIEDNEVDEESLQLFRVFSNNLLGNVAGMHMFRENLKGNGGHRVYECLIDVLNFRYNSDRGFELFNDIRDRYLVSYAPSQLSSKLYATLAKEILNFSLVPSEELELSRHLNSTTSTKNELDPCSRDAFLNTQRMLFYALETYWVPRYILHVFTSYPISLVQDLLKPSPGDSLSPTLINELLQKRTLLKLSTESRRKRSTMTEFKPLSMSLSPSVSIVVPASFLDEKDEDLEEDNASETSQSLSFCLSARTLGMGQDSEASVSRCSSELAPPSCDVMTCISDVTVKSTSDSDDNEWGVIDNINQNQKATSSEEPEDGESSSSISSLDIGIDTVRPNGSLSAANRNRDRHSSKRERDDNPRTGSRDNSRSEKKDSKKKERKENKRHQGYCKYINGSPDNEGDEGSSRHGNRRSKRREKRKKVKIEELLEMNATENSKSRDRKTTRTLMQNSDRSNSNYGYNSTSCDDSADESYGNIHSSAGKRKRRNNGKGKKSNHGTGRDDGDENRFRGSERNNNFADTLEDAPNVVCDQAWRSAVYVQPSSSWDLGAMLGEEDEDMMIIELADKVSVEMLTSEALNEMITRKESMTYFNSLLFHYVFGLRDMDVEVPNSDRRTLCLLSCDELAGFPFRKYLNDNQGELLVHYYDYWNAMRRHLQIENLCLMGSYNYRNDSKDILKMKKQQVTYITKRFLTSRDLDGSILQDDIKYRIQEDLQSGTLPIFINATQDVVSTILGIPVMQYVVHDVTSFRKKMFSEYYTLRVPRKVMRRREAETLPKVQSNIGTFFNRETQQQAAESIKPSIPSPWVFEPKTEPIGDFENMIPTGSWISGIDKVQGILCEQHRVQAFQFAIVMREDLWSMPVCNLPLLVRMLGSNYGTLHISFDEPKMRPLPSELRPIGRLSSTLLTADDLAQMETESQRKSRNIQEAMLEFAQYMAAMESHYTFPISPEGLPGPTDMLTGAVTVPSSDAVAPEDQLQPEGISPPYKYSAPSTPLMRPFPSMMEMMTRSGASSTTHTRPSSAVMEKMTLSGAPSTTLMRPSPSMMEMMAHAGALPASLMQSPAMMEMMARAGVMFPDLMPSRSRMELLARAGVEQQSTAEAALQRVPSAKKIPVLDQEDLKNHIPHTESMRRRLDFKLNLHSLKTIESILNDDEQLGTFIGVVEEEEVNMPQEFWNAVENWESLPEKKKPEMIQSIAKKFVVDGPDLSTDKKEKKMDRATKIQQIEKLQNILKNWEEKFRREEEVVSDEESESDEVSETESTMDFSTEERKKPRAEKKQRAIKLEKKESIEISETVSTDSVSSVTQNGYHAVDTKDKKDKAKVKMSLKEKQTQEKLAAMIADQKMRKKRAMKNWQAMMPKLETFFQFLKNPDQVCLFEEFLKQEVKRAEASNETAATLPSTKGKGKNKKNKVEPIPDGDLPQISTRVVFKNVVIQVNKLPQDLRFLVEVHRYRQQGVSQVRFNLPIIETMLLKVRAKAIIDCYLKSVIYPEIQINCCSPDEVSKIMISFYRKGPSYGLFHGLYIRLLPLLYSLWKAFCKNVSIDEMSGTIRIDTKRFVGTLPHPTMPSVDYTECSEDDFQKMVMIPGDPLGEPRLNFSIGFGFRLVVSGKTVYKPKKGSKSGAKEKSSKMHEDKCTVDMNGIKPVPAAATGDKHVHAHVHSARTNRMLPIQRDPSKAVGETALVEPKPQFNKDQIAVSKEEEGPISKPSRIGSKIQAEKVKEVTAETKKKEVTLETKKKEVTVETKKEEVTSEMKKKEVTAETKKEEVTAETKKKEVTAETKKEEVTAETKKKEVTAETKKKEVTAETKKEEEPTGIKAQAEKGKEQTVLPKKGETPSLKGTKEQGEKEPTKAATSEETPETKPKSGKWKMLGKKMDELLTTTPKPILTGLQKVIAEKVADAAAKKEEESVQKQEQAKKPALGKKPDLKPKEEPSLGKVAKEDAQKQESSSGGHSQTSPAIAGKKERDKLVKKKELDKADAKEAKEDLSKKKTDLKPAKDAKVKDDKLSAIKKMPKESAQQKKELEDKKAKESAQQKKELEDKKTKESARQKKELEDKKAKDRAERRAARRDDASSTKSSRRSDEEKAAKREKASKAKTKALPSVSKKKIPKPKKKSNLRKFVEEEEEEEEEEEDSDEDEPAKKAIPSSSRQQTKEAESVTQVGKKAHVADKIKSGMEQSPSQEDNVKKHIIEIASTPPSPFTADKDRELHRFSYLNLPETTPKELKEAEDWPAQVSRLIYILIKARCLLMDNQQPPSDKIVDFPSRFPPIPTSFLALHKLRTARSGVAIPVTSRFISQRSSSNVELRDFLETIVRQTLNRGSKTGKATQSKARRLTLPKHC